MARFFFDFDDRAVAPNKDGVEMSDREQATLEGARALADVAAEMIRKNGHDLCVSMSVRSGDGELVFAGTLTFKGIRYRG